MSLDAWQDTDCKTQGVTAARKGSVRWDITMEDGWSTGCFSVEDSEAAGVSEIKAGDRITIWGNPNQQIRGAAINGNVIFYRAKWQQSLKDAEDRDADNQRRQDKLDKSRAERDATRAGLPDVFQARLLRFDQENPYWRRDYESYELSCCVDAVKIAAAMKTGEEVKRFAALPWKEQHTMVPDLFDGHSGNSFGMAVLLAYHFVTDPALVVREHGALCNLVGCKAYGDGGKS